MKKVLFGVIIFMGCQLASVAQDAQDFFWVPMKIANN